MLIQKDKERCSCHDVLHEEDLVRGGAEKAEPGKDHPAHDGPCAEAISHHLHHLELELDEIGKPPLAKEE